MEEVTCLAQILSLHFPCISNKRKTVANTKGRKEVFLSIITCSTIQNRVITIAKGIPRNVSS